MGTQSEWNAAAAMLGDIEVCGCDLEPFTGQTYYRLVNYLSGLIGSGTITTPPAPTGTTLASDLKLIKAYVEGTTLTQITFYQNSSLLAFWGIFQLGQGLGNYVIQMPSQGMGLTYYNADALWPLLWTWPDTDPLSVCCWDLNLVPLGVCACTVSGP